METREIITASLIDIFQYYDYLSLATEYFGDYLDFTDLELPLTEECLEVLEEGDEKKTLERLLWMINYFNQRYTSLGQDILAKKISEVVILGQDSKYHRLSDLYPVIYAVFKNHFKPEENPRVLNLAIHLLSHLDIDVLYEDREDNFSQKIGTFSDVLMYRPYSEVEAKMIFAILESRAISFMDLDFSLDKFNYSEPGTVDFSDELNIHVLTQLFLYVFVTHGVLDSISQYTKDRFLLKKVDVLKSCIYEKFDSIINSLDIDIDLLIEKLSLSATHRVLKGNLTNRPDYPEHYTPEQIANIRSGIQGMASSYSSWQCVESFLQTDENGNPNFTEKDVRSVLRTWFSSLEKNRWNQNHIPGFPVETQGLNIESINLAAMVDGGQFDFIEIHDRADEVRPIISHEITNNPLKVALHRLALKSANLDYFLN
jgi:hypothetical protein